MAVVAGRSDLRQQDAGNLNWREWVANSSVNDSAVGAAVTVTIAMTTAGATAPPVPDTLTLEYFVDNGTTAAEATATLNATAASQTVTLTPSKAGIVRMRIHAVRTSGAAGAGNYNIDTDLANNTPITGYSVAIHDQGYVRATTTATLNPSNVTPGGANPATYFYPDRVALRAVLAAVPYQSYPVTLTAGSLAAAVSSATATFDNDFGVRAVAPVNFPAVPALVTPTATPGASGLTGQPWTVLTTSPATFTPDPRLRMHPHTQKAPALTADALGGPYTDDLLFIISADLWNGWFLAANNNSVPQDGLTVTGSLDDPTITAPGQAGLGHHTFTCVTKPTGAPTGWLGVTAANGATFTPSAPAGKWHWYAASVTDGTSTWAGAYLVRSAQQPDVGPWATYDYVNFVSAYRDNLYLLVGVGKATGTHPNPVPPKPGDSVLIGMTVRKNGQGYPVDAGSTPAVRVARFRQDTGAAEYFVGNDVAGVAMTVSVGDPNIWTYTWVTPANQEEDVYIFFVSCQVDGGAKYAETQMFLSRFGFTKFDGAGFLGFPHRPVY